MNKKNVLIYFLNIILIIPFFIITKNNNIFLYTLSYSLYILLIMMFSHLNISGILKKYLDLEYHYTKNKIYKTTILSILIISLMMGLLVTLSGLLLESLFSIKGIFFVYLMMSFSIFIIPTFNITLDYLEAHDFNKLKNFSIVVYYVSNFIFLIIASIIFFDVLKLEDYLSIGLLYTINILSFIIIHIIIYLIIFKNKKVLFKATKTREEVKINYKNIIKDILSNNIIKSFYNIIKYSFCYLSIILVYLILTYRYFYNYNEVANVINITYFYGIRLVLIFIILIRYISLDKKDKLIKLITKKDYIKFREDFTSFFYYIIRLMMACVILVSIISGPIWMLIFKNNEGSSILLGLMILAFTFILYLTFMDILISLNNKKKIMIILLSSLIIKLIITIPMIDSMWRMGYDLMYGDFLSSSLAYVVCIILSLVFISKKCKLNFTKDFDKILNIIYENIILCFILVLLTFIFKIEVKTRLSAILIIILYVSITISYFVILKKIKIKKLGDNR